MVRGVLALALAVVLAGCTGTSTGSHLGPAPTLDFGAMSLQTVPLEPLETRGVIEVAWNGPTMGVYTLHEGGMPAMAVRAGATLYTTQSGMGWTQWDLASYVEDQGRGFRYLAWDVPALLANGTLTAMDAGHLTATASFRQHGQPVGAVVEVDHAGSSVLEARIRTPADPEAPFTLRPLGHPFPFPVQVPGGARPADDVTRLDGQARAGHATILGWIHQYKNQLGNLPQDVSAQGLAVQRLNQAWPTDPYDGQAMRNQKASGHFEWDWCSAQDASFHGYGWDGAPLNEDFGRGCLPP